MPGGILQLAAYGSENEYLHGNPQITFFKLVYRRHTNFAMEAIDVTFDKSVSLSYDKSIKLTAKLPRNGDLINDMYLKLKIPDILSDDIKQFYWTPKVGLSMIDYVDLFIGGQKIERLHGKFLDIHHQLSVTEGKHDAFRQMVGDSSFVSYNAKYATGYYPGYDSLQFVNDAGSAATPADPGQQVFINKFFNSPYPIF